MIHTITRTIGTTPEETLLNLTNADIKDHWSVVIKAIDGDLRLLHASDLTNSDGFKLGTGETISIDMTRNEEMYLAADHEGSGTVTVGLIIQGV